MVAQITLHEKKRSELSVRQAKQRWNNFSYHLKAKFNDCLIIHSK